MFELEAEDQFDFILTVTAPKQIRLERVLQRDDKSADEVLSIMNNQWDEHLKIQKSDYVIYNIDVHQTKIDVEKINNEILKKIN